MHRIFLFNDAKSLNYSKTDFSCSLDQQTASQIGISTLFLFPKRVHFTLQLSLNLHLRRKNFIFCDVAMLFSMTFVCILQNFKSKEYIYRRLLEPTLKYQATVKLPCATVPVIFIKTKAENKGQE